MRNLFGRFCCLIARFALSLRYRIEVKGLKNIPKGGGILFLPNHPALVDPMILASRLWPRWKIRPLITEYVFYIPGLNWMFRKLAKALSIPDFVRGTNSYKEMRAEEAFDAVSCGLSKGDNFIVYPAGHLKRTPEERLGGSFGVHELLEMAPDAKVVLVRTRGLWGSIFGWGVTGKQPHLGPGFAFGLKTVLKNLIFFTPRREVTVEFEELDRATFPEDRAAFNRSLEAWYNAPSPEPLTLVSYSVWKKDLPEVTYDRPYVEADISKVPPKIKERVVRKIAKLAKVEEGAVTSEKHLQTDLHLDSLDIAELVFALEKEEGGIAPPSNFDLLTVGAVIALAAGQLIVGQEGERHPPKGWEEKERPMLEMPEGETIGEVFLKVCDRMGKAVACADERSGVRTYPTLKRRALLLSRLIRNMPGGKVGILLPSSVACATVVIACYLAGKVPVMLNWTMGRRYLEQVKEIADIQVVLSSWTFLSRLEGVDLTPIHEELISLESLMGEVTFSALFKAYRRSHLGAEALMKKLKIDHLSSKEWAVLLFTSGTEAAPKAVPLTHHNLLSNQRAGLACVHYEKEDCFLSILPPFHSLGFSFTTLLPLMIGGKVVFSPNPTESHELARVAAVYKPTLICSAPTFLRDLIRVAKPGQLDSLWEFITGAEKAPQELFKQVEKLSSNAHLLEGYGITECSPLVTVNRPNTPPKGVGKAIPSVELLIIHPEIHTPLATGEVGLILTSGPNVFEGYLGDAKDPFLHIAGKRWYNTGDLGSVDEEGYLTLAGRLKRFVKVGGEMISLPALEGELEKILPEGGLLAVIPKEEEGARPTLHLFADRALDLEKANQALKEAGFSNLARLNSVHKVDEMPLLGTGKINFRALTKAAALT